MMKTEELCSLAQCVVDSLLISVDGGRDVHIDSQNGQALLQASQVPSSSLWFFFFHCDIEKANEDFLYITNSVQILVRNNTKQGV